MPPGIPDQNLFASIEMNIVHDLQINPGDMQSVFKELMNLKMSESAEAFGKDLLKLNQDLHKQHLLPYFALITEDPNDPDGFDLTNLLTGEEMPDNQPIPMEQTPESGNFNGTGSGAGQSGGGRDGAGDGGDGNGSANGAGGGDVSAISDPGGAPWDGVSQGDMDLADKAAEYLGRQLWADTQYANVCQGGNVGCAASVTKVLQDCGITYASSAGVVDLASQLTANGWTTSSGVETAQPGDVMYGDNGGDDQHIGIVGLDRGNLVLYNNWSKDGKWHEEPLNSSYIATHFKGNVRILHAPAKLTTHRAGTGQPAAGAIADAAPAGAQSAAAAQPAVAMNHG